MAKESVECRTDSLRIGSSEKQDRIASDLFTVFLRKLSPAAPSPSDKLGLTFPSDDIAAVLVMVIPAENGSCLAPNTIGRCRKRTRNFAANWLAKGLFTISSNS
jgi:hypothetical protein